MKVHLLLVSPKSTWYRAEFYLHRRVCMAFYIHIYICSLIPNNTQFSSKVKQNKIMATVSILWIFYHFSCLSFTSFQVIYQKLMGKVIFVLCWSRIGKQVRKSAYSVLSCGSKECFSLDLRCSMWLEGWKSSSGLPERSTDGIRLW